MPVACILLPATTTTGKADRRKQLPVAAVERRQQGGQPAARARQAHADRRARGLEARVHGPDRAGVVRGNANVFLS
jgi:hypothetical protein